MRECITRWRQGIAASPSLSELEAKKHSGKTLPTLPLYHKSLDLLSRGKAGQTTGLYRSVPVDDLLILLAGIFT